MGDRLRAGMPSRYVTSQLGQLSLASHRGRLIEYQLRLVQGRECHLCLYSIVDNGTLLYVLIGCSETKMVLGEFSTHVFRCGRHTVLVLLTWLE